MFFVFSLQTWVLFVRLFAGEQLVTDMFFYLYSASFTDLVLDHDMIPQAAVRCILP